MILFRKLHIYYRELLKLRTPTSPEVNKHISDIRFVVLIDEMQNYISIFNLFHGDMVRHSPYMAAKEVFYVRGVCKY